MAAEVVAPGTRTAGTWQATPESEPIPVRVVHSTSDAEVHRATTNCWCNPEILVQGPFGEFVPWGHPWHEAA